MEKDKVVLQIECNYHAASVLLSILKKSQMIGELRMGNYCCFYVDGEVFKIDKIQTEPEGIIERVVMNAAGGFAYKIGDKLYKRFPDDQICLVDFGEDIIEAIAPEKEWAFCGRRLDMENVI